MAGISTYLANKLLDHSLGVASYTMPSGVYLALFTSDPTPTGSGTEVSGSGYARQQVTWNAAASRESTLNGSETFGPAGGSWGTVTHWGVFDSSTAGNLLWFGSLSASKAADSGDSLVAADESFTCGFPTS